MPVAPTFKMHVREFNAYLEAAHRKMGKGVSWKSFVKAEAAAVLAKTASKTNRANLGDIDKKYSIKNRKTKNLPEGVKARGNKGKQVKGSHTPQNDKLTPFISLVDGGKKYYTKNFYPDKVYDRLKARLAFYKERAKNRAFSGKATWLLIATKAGVSTKKFKSRARLMRAISAQGGSFASNQVENGKQIKKLVTFAIKVDNSANCCLNKNARGSFALRSAMAGRAGFMRHNARKGVFKKASDVAKKYPGVKVR